MRLRTHLLLFTLTVVFFTMLPLLQGQSSINGRVISEKGEPVEFANALLIQVSDSSLVKGAVVSENGTFQISNIAAGEYRLKASMTGFADFLSPSFTFSEESQSKDFGDITLHEDAVIMKAVEVVAKKPLFEQRIDRMVVNVANSITASGTNALEILERSPGVVVNHQSNLISISGKNGVVIMLNGRVQYMPVEAVVSLMEGMSSDNIERIEIINTPPAGFDAEGNAGYINIVLRKSLDNGFNGAFTLNFGVGHGEQGSATGNFNYRKGKANLYGDYSYLHEGQTQVFAFYRRILLNGDHVETDTRSDRDPDRNDHNARIGLDYQITPKTVFGTLLSAYNTKWTMEAHNSSTISTNEVIDTNIRVLNTELNQWKHIGGNLYLQHTFGDGHTITFNGDALWYRDNNPTSYHNMYFDPAFNPIYDNFTRAGKITPIRIKVASLDYVRGIGKKIKSESGLKISHSHFTNDVGVDYLDAGTWTPDPDLTANYDLTEDIFAAYASLETPLGKGFTLKAGLRYEYTSSNLGSAEVTDIVDRKFGEWFPSVFLSKDFSENYALNLSYSKRITRPTFNDMAPFVIFIDPSTFFSGNPALQPAIANKIGLGCKLKTVVFNVEYAREDSTIARFQSMVLPGTNKQLLFAENFRYTNTWSATLSIPVSPFKWWNMYYNLNGNYQKASRFSEGVISDYAAGGFSGFSSQTFTLSKNLTLELTGFYSAGGLFGIVKINSFGTVNAGLQFKFGAQGNTFRVGYDDIFKTLRYSGDATIPSLDQYFRALLIFQQPTFKISYSQHFGNQKMKERRDRGTGSEEERGRITN